MRACGACHDDVVWTLDYTANGQTMEVQPDDSTCKVCHGRDDFSDDSGGLSVKSGHRHPLDAPAFNTGLNVALSGVGEAGASDGDGKIDPGEKIQLSLAFTDDAGASVAASALTAIEAVVSGPTSNANLVVATTIPKALLSGAQPYSLRLPPQ